MINKKLIHINEKKTFENVKEEIPDSSICFIKESQQIYTHNQLYGSDVTVTPYPKGNEIIYSTTDGEAILLDNINIISNIYYKDRGFGIITFKSAIINSLSIQGKTTLKNIIFPEGVQGLGTLQGCSSLESIHIPSTVTTISSYCFQNCKLHSVILPEGLTAIPNYCFENNKDLIHIHIPQSVTTIGDGCFSNCVSLKYIDLSYVTNLGNGCFSNNFSLTMVTAKNLNIGGGAFNNCSSLLGFHNKNDGNIIITLKEGTTNHFTDCKNLSISINHHKSINLLNTTILPKQIFKSCLALKEINIPNTINELGDYCLEFTNLDTLIVPSSIKTISDTAFSNVQCKILDWGLSYFPKVSPRINKLETLILRSTTVVKDVEEYVSTFTRESEPIMPLPLADEPMAISEDIEPLTNLDTYIGTPNNWLKIYVPNNLLAEYRMTYPTLINHLYPINGEDVVPYPGSNEIVYTTISGNAIELDETNSSIKNNIYYKNKGFGVITAIGANTLSFKDNTDLLSLSFGSNYDFLASNMCEGCINLQKVNVYNTSVRIGNFTFKNSGIKEINFENIISIGQDGFRNSKIENVVIREDCSVNNNSFIGCKNLVSVVLPDNITTIPSFEDCFELSSINIPSNVTRINSFKNCTSLKNLSLPNGLVYLGSLQNIGLESLVVPGTVEQISSFALTIPSLKYLKLNEGIKDIGAALYGDFIFIDTIILPSTINISHNSFSTKVRRLDSSSSTIQLFPSVDLLETLILRYNGVVQDVDTYVTTFIDEESEATKAYYANIEQGIMPLTDLDTYIGNPNSWLKIYVPANQLKNYQERYPTLKRHLHPITGEDIYALKDETTKEIEDSINYAFEWAEFD